MTIENKNRVRLTQKFSVSQKILFEKCLAGELLKECVGDLLKHEGSYNPGDRYECTLKGGTDFIRGEFKRVIPHTLIEFTWETMAGSKSTGETTIALHFSPDGTGSKLELVQDNISSNAAAEDQDEGWAFNLDSFSKRLASNA